MKHLALALFSVLLCASSAFSQRNVENKQAEPVSLSELAKQPVCGVQHIAYLSDNIKLEPQNTDLYLMRADCFKRTHNPDFLKDILAIIHLNPKLNDYLSVVLKNLVLSKQPGETEANLNYLAAAIPKHWLLYAVSAENKKVQGDYQGA